MYILAIMSETNPDEISSNSDDFETIDTDIDCMEYVEEDFDTDIIRIVTKMVYQLQFDINNIKDNPSLFSDKFYEDYVILVRDYDFVIRYDPTLQLLVELLKSDIDECERLCSSVAIQKIVEKDNQEIRVEYNQIINQGNTGSEPAISTSCGNTPSKHLSIDYKEAYDPDAPRYAIDYNSNKTGYSNHASRKLMHDMLNNANHSSNYSSNRDSGSVESPDNIHITSELYLVLLGLKNQHLTPFKVKTLCENLVTILHIYGLQISQSKKFVNTIIQIRHHLDIALTKHKNDAIIDLVDRIKLSTDYVDSDSDTDFIQAHQILTDLLEKVEDKLATDNILTDDFYEESKQIILNLDQISRYPLLEIISDKISHIFKYHKSNPEYLIVSKKLDDLKNRIEGGHPINDAQNELDACMQLHQDAISQSSYLTKLVSEIMRSIWQEL